jgi:AIPR protein
MHVSTGSERRYITLCNVLDSLCREAPATATIYHPPKGDEGKRIQARSRALLHLFLKARFGLIDFTEREAHVTDGSHDGGVDAYFIDQKTKRIFVLQSKFRATPGNFESNNMSADDLIKMDVKRILNGEKCNELGQPYNDRVGKGFQKAVQKLPDAGSYVTQVILLGNPQLVNGGQTAYTLSRIYEDCIPSGNYDVFKGKEVLLRVITFLGKVNKKTSTARLNLISDISKASNSQTRIDESDRRSNDEIQLTLQSEFFKKYGIYYERKRGEFADGIQAGYIDRGLLINREKLVRVTLACAYRVNQARSNIGQFFKPEALEGLFDPKHVAKYAYGYEVLRILENERKKKPKTKGDRYHTNQFGQGLRYGQYAIVAVCANSGQGKGKSEEEAVETVLAQWPKFESWARKRRSNSTYRKDGAFDYVNYYKGATINTDLKRYSFAI